MDYAILCYQLFAIHELDQVSTNADTSFLSIQHFRIGNPLPDCDIAVWY